MPEWVLVGSSQTKKTQSGTVHRVFEIYEAAQKDASGEAPIFIRPETPTKKKKFTN